MTKKRLPATPEELDGFSAKFFETIKGESDRGCVLVAAAFLDEALEFLLRSKMTREANIVKSSIEPLFTGIGPLKSFWAKIELCRAFDLLGDYQYSDLTRIRNLRNYFAHSYIDATFNDQKVVAIISEFIHFGLKLFPPGEKEKAKADYLRRRFMMTAAWLAGTLHKEAGMVSDVTESTDG